MIKYLLVALSMILLAGCQGLVRRPIYVVNDPVCPPCVCADQTVGISRTQQAITEENAVKPAVSDQKERIIQIQPIRPLLPGERPLWYYWP